MPQYWWVPSISAAGFCLASWCQGRGDLDYSDYKDEF